MDPLLTWAGDSPMAPRSPVSVRRHRIMDVLRSGWMWECAVHQRHRGFHRFDTHTDLILARMRKPSRPHPWERAMAGAIQHWHEYHDPNPCTCCAAKHRPERMA